MKSNFETADRARKPRIKTFGQLLTVLLLLAALCALAMPARASEFYTNNWTPPVGLNYSTNGFYTNATGTPWSPIPGKRALLTVTYVTTGVSISALSATNKAVWTFQGSPQPTGTNLMSSAGGPPAAAGNATPLNYAGLFSVTNWWYGTNGTFTVAAWVDGTNFDGEQQILPTALDSTGDTNTFVVQSFTWSQLKTQ